MLRTAENRAREAASRFRVRTVQCWKSLSPPLLPSGLVPTDTFSTMDCFVSIDSTNDWEWCISFSESLLCVCVRVCAQALKRQWVTAEDVVQTWYAGEQQKELKKNPATENLVILSVSIMPKGLGLWGKREGLSWEKMGEVTRRVQDESGCLSQEWPGTTGLRSMWEESDDSAPLWGSLHPSQYQHSHHLFLSSCWMFLRRARLTWLSDPKVT